MIIASINLASMAMLLIGSGIQFYCSYKSYVENSVVSRAQRHREDIEHYRNDFKGMSSTGGKKTSDGLDFDAAINIMNAALEQTSDINRENLNTRLDALEVSNSKRHRLNMGAWGLIIASITVQSVLFIVAIIVDQI